MQTTVGQPVLCHVTLLHPYLPTGIIVTAEAVHRQLRGYSRLLASAGNTMQANGANSSCAFMTQAFEEHVVPEHGKISAFEQVACYHLTGSNLRDWQQSHCSILLLFPIC
jgi:hypothetical protein